MSERVAGEVIAPWRPRGPDTGSQLMEEIEAAFKVWDEERRGSVRVPLKLDVRWGGRGGTHLAQTADVGLGGCFITSAEAVAVGSRLIFEMQTPTENWMRLFGEVVYELPGDGFGVRFKLLNEVNRETLTLLMEYASTQTTEED